MVPIEPTSRDYDSLKELASVARLITYARESLQALDASFPVWCLDLALAAVLREMSLIAQGATAAEDGDAPALHEIH